MRQQEGSSVEEQLLEFEDQEIFNGRWKGIDLRRSRMLAPVSIEPESDLREWVEADAVEL